MSVRDESLLRRTLWANALFSATSGLGCILAADWLATVIPAGQGQFVSTGIQLLIFAAAVAFLASRSRMHRTWVRRLIGVVIGMDLLWVLGSGIILLIPGVAVSLGKALIATAALLVGTFALMQIRGVLQVGTTAPAT